jgi:SAM-dependent methyltransferase
MAAPRPAYEVPIPPPELRFMDATEEGFLAIGDEIAADLEALCNLTAEADVVDIGSGYGRVAHALLRRPDFQGSYHGLDILARHIEWCVTHLSPLDPRFRFTHLDLKNDRYNPEGSEPAASARLPVEDAAADVVVVSSVFTHMYPDDVRHYMDEIARVLRPEGRAFITFFLIDEWLRAHQERLATKLAERGGSFWRYARDEEPLFMVGYDDRWVDIELEDAGLVRTMPPRPGTWAGQGSAPAYQDAVIVRRR